MLKAFSNVEKLQATLWCAAGMAAPAWAAYEVRQTLMAAHSAMPINIFAGAAFVGSLAAVGLASYGASFYWRFLEKLGGSVLALCGDGLAQGRVELWAAQEHVWREWRRFQGRHGWEPSAASVYEFVRVEYGVDLSRAAKKTGILAPRQLRKLVDGITSLLMRYGRWNKASTVEQREDAAEVENAQVETPREAYQPEGHDIRAGVSQHMQAVEHASAHGSNQWFDVNTDPIHSQGLFDSDPRKKPAANQWVDQGPRRKRQEQVIEFDIPMPVYETRRKDDDMPSIEEILARATAPQRREEPVEPPKASVESGALLRRISEHEVQYVHRCEACGYVEGAIRKARRPGKRSKFNANFRCPKCRNVQKVVIAGEF